MSGLLERAASAFVTPSPAPEPAVAPPRFAPRALVLGSARDAVPVAAALAGGLRERERAAGAVLVTWPSPDPPRPALGTPAASRLVANLQSRGLAAVARGRLAWLALGDDELDLARRALAAVDVPAVVAITGPRTAATDELLAEQDHVVLVAPPDADPQLAELARQGLAEQGIPVVVRGPLISARSARHRARGLGPSEGAGVSRLRAERGQASLVIVGGLVALVLGALVLALVARGGGPEARAQRAADLGALAGARAMHDAYARLFEPVFADRARPGAEHVSKPAYLALGRAAAERVAQANGARGVTVTFPDGSSFAPTRVRVTVRDVFEVRTGDARRTARDRGGRRGRARTTHASSPAPAAATPARSPPARASGCGRTSPAPSIAWSAPRARTGSG